MGRAPLRRPEPPGPGGRRARSSPPSSRPNRRAWTSGRSSATPAPGVSMSAVGSVRFASPTAPRTRSARPTCSIAGLASSRSPRSGQRSAGALGHYEVPTLPSGPCGARSSTTSTTCSATSFRQFVDKELAPHHQEWEAAGIVDRDLFAGRRARTGSSGWPCPRSYGGGGVDDFRYNLIIGEEVQRSGIGGAGLGLTLHNDICLPYFLRSPTRSRSARWLPGHLLGRAHHRHRHDRAGHRLRPGVDDHHGHPRRRPLRRQRLEDVHHQRHQRRPGDHRGEDRPAPAPQGA